jgi:hypothetical protein
LLASCEDPFGRLGFPASESKFQVRFKEFDLPVSTFQIDSLNTVNFSGSPTKRLLAGAVNDPVFGQIKSRVFTQILPSSRPNFAASATFERATITLAYDYYYYGPKEAVSMDLQMYELADSIDPNQGYYFNTNLALGAKIGEAISLVNPGLFDEALTKNSDRDTRNDVVDTVYSILDPSFGERLFLLARDGGNNGINDYTQFTKFRQLFKGIAVVPVSFGHVFGINPSSVNSRITIFYREDGVSKRFALSLSEAITGFSSFEVNRAGVSLPAFSDHYTNFTQGDIAATQAGVGLMTRVDFSEVYSFFDEIQFPILNSVQLRLESPTTHFRVPNGIRLRIIKPNNRNRLPLRNVDGSNGSSVVEDLTFEGRYFVIKNSDFTLDVLGDDNSPAQLRATTEAGNTVFSGFFTTFMQTQLRLPKTDRLATIGLIAANPDFQKSMNGFSFLRDKVKLRVYYTLPESN